MRFALSYIADVYLLLHWHSNDAEDRFITLNQRDVDGELAIAVDEFLGAVEWVHQPIA